MPIIQLGPIAVFAPAKINLYLHVTGQRDDGFHLLDSLIVFADYGDQVSVAPADQLTLSIDGPFAAGLPNDIYNLVIQAAHLLAERAGIEAKAEITLTKNLPVASGIGGGSADAAATLQALTQLWQINLDREELRDLACKLGADVPVCLAGKPSFVSGIGEIITPAPTLPETWLVLVNPGEPVATPEVFAKRDSDFTDTTPFDGTPATTAELAALLNERTNDLAAPATLVAPVIAEVLSVLHATNGQLLSRLSGSGATCFALFSDETSAQEAAKSLQSDHPSWWVQAAAVLV